MTQKDLTYKINEKIDKWVRLPEKEISTPTLVEMLMPIINQHVKEVIGEDEEHIEGMPNQRLMEERNGLRAAQRERAGL